MDSLCLAFLSIKSDTACHPADIVHNVTEVLVCCRGVLGETVIPYSFHWDKLGATSLADGFA
jgi:hypothetical protein